MAEVSFPDALAVWTRIGLLSFGGPAGQIALMHRMLVEERKWIDENRFLRALNFCMLLPGPEAQQLATYIGWMLHGTRGGIAAGVLFVLPGALVVLLLSALYHATRDLSVVAGLFYGIKAAVLAIVLQALLRIAGRALKSRASWSLAAGAFLALFLFGVTFPLVILAAGGMGAVLGLTPGATHAESPTVSLAPSGIRSAGRTLAIAALWLALWLGPLAAILLWLGPGHIFAQIGSFFSTMAVVTFGGAYAVLAYVAQEAVQTYAWLTPGEMLDGLGLAETTPGPLILVLEFVGFLAAARDPGLLPPLLAGSLGAIWTLWVTFVPSIMWIIVGAPYVEALTRDKRLSGALTGITAAVVGVMANLALWFALHVLFRTVGAWEGYGLRFLLPSAPDPAAMLIAAAAGFALLRLRFGVLPVLGLGAAAGAGIRLIFEG
ncbi:MAG: chromate efflux transporter [Alphaproteobacteria bacterium]|nr:chromate efflux transporter [Alphaproteobacteria bacterium]